MLGKKYYCRIHRNLTILDISTNLINLLEYDNKDYFLQKHLSALMPHYFCFIKNGELNISKAIVYLTKKNGEFIIVKVKVKKLDDVLVLKFKLVRNKYLNQFAYNELQFSNYIQHVANIGVVCFNPQGYIITANNLIGQWYQVLPQSLIGTKIEKLLHLTQDETTDFYKLLQQVENRFTKDSIIKSSENDSLILRWEISKIQSQYGIFFLSLVHNISTEYKIKKELDYQQKLFQKVFELSPLPIFIFNKNYKVEKVNQAFLELLEVDRSLAESLDLKILADKRPEYLFTDVIEHRKEAIYEGYYNTTYSKKTIFTRTITTPVEIDGEPKGLGIILDLTKLKKTEEELIQKQNFYKTMVDMAIAGIGITDMDENLVFVNKAFANMLGYEEEEMMNTNLSLYCSPQQYEIFKKQSEIRKLRKNSVYEATLIHKNGQPVNILLFSTPYVNSNNQIVGTLAVLVDISYQKMLLQLYDKLKQDYQHQQKQTELLINALWKRFNFFLPTLVELLKLDKTSLEKESLKELEQNIQKNTLLLSITYKDMQLLLDLFSEKYKVKPKIVSLREMFDKIKNSYRNDNYTNYCSIDWQINFEEELTVEIDENSVSLCIEKILHNLIFRNHAKKIHITSTASYNVLVLVFNMYHNENHIPAQIINFKETHLCHVIVSKLLQKVKGKLSVTDTTIEVAIPYKAIDGKKLMNNSFELEIKDNQYSTFIWSNKTILYVIDDNFLQQWIYDALASTKVQLIPITCDAQFINYILKYPFTDLVLIHSSLLDKNEIDYVGLIKRFLPDAKIICLGEHMTDEKKCNGIDEFLTITDKFADDLRKTLSKFF